MSEAERTRRHNAQTSSRHDGPVLPGPAAAPSRGLGAADRLARQRIDVARRDVSALRLALARAHAALEPGTDERERRMLARRAGFKLEDAQRALTEARRYLTMAPELQAEYDEVAAALAPLVDEVAAVKAAAIPAVNRTATREAATTDPPAAYEEADRGTLDPDVSAETRPTTDPGPVYEDSRGTLDVQRKATDSASAADVHGIAAAGVAGASAPLPHLDAIQASFGRHDVSHVRAAIGGEATAASDAIGAEAYATGDRVAFRDAPSLHTAAHEAAHVVQQQAGVQLKGGVGESGDACEQHADAVADAVVRGESAEGLLGADISGTHVSTASRVQRKDPSVGGQRSERDISPEEERVQDKSKITSEWRRALTAAAALGREVNATLEALSERPDEARSAGLAGCDAMADHIFMFELVVDPKKATSLVPLVEDVAAVAHELTSRMEALQLGESNAASRLLDEVYRLHILVPDAQQVKDDKSAGRIRKKSDEKASRYDGVQLMADNLSAARAKLSLGLEKYRAELDGNSEQTSATGGSGRNKATILQAAVDAIVPWLEYVERTMTRGDFGADSGDRALQREMLAFHAEAQRFIYWAMMDAAVEEPAQQLEAAAAPLVRRFGLDPLVVASGAPRTADEKGTLATHALEYRDGWHRIYAAQRGALQRLIDSPEREKEPGALDSALWTVLAASSFSGVLGLAAGAVGAAVEQSIDRAGRVHKNAVKTAAQDIVKSVANAIFGDHAPSGQSSDARRLFFERMREALIDIETEHLRRFQENDMMEAERSPVARGQLRREAKAVESSAEAIAEQYASRAVQDWATHQASHAHGRDDRTGGVDLDGVGSFEQGGDARGYEVVDRSRPTGVLELMVVLGEPEDSRKILRATAGGLRADDAERIVGTVGELTMPVQLRCYGEDTTTRVAGQDQIKTPTMIISRNVEGTVWLSQADVGGTAWLARHGAGDVMSGATRVFEELATHMLPKVEGA